MVVVGICRRRHVSVDSTISLAFGYRSPETLSYYLMNGFWGQPRPFNILIRMACYPWKHCDRN